VQVDRTGVGRYQVRFVNMAGQGGVAHASAYGANNICTVTSWGPTLGDEVVNVRCYTAAGAAVDSRFIAHVAGDHVNSRFVLSYTRDVVPVSATVDNYGPAPDVAGWSSPSGAAPVITEIDNDGDYLVSFPGAGTAGGHAFAGIMGTPPMFCTIHSWTTSGGAMNLRVRCYEPGGGQLNPAVLFNVGWY
jgi:hypothetical protein